MRRYLGKTDKHCQIKYTLVNNPKYQRKESHIKIRKPSQLHENITHKICGMQINQCLNINLEHKKVRMKLMTQGSI